MAFCRYYKTTLEEAHRKCDVVKEFMEYSNNEGAYHFCEDGCS